RTRAGAGRPPALRRPAARCRARPRPAPSAPPPPARPRRCPPAPSRSRPARARASGRRAALGRRRRSGFASGAFWLARGDLRRFLRRSYPAPTFTREPVGMRRQRRTTIIVVGGALAIASVGYGLGTQADDGTAIADNAAAEQDGNGAERGGAPPLPFERGAPPGLNRLA